MNSDTQYTVLSNRIKLMNAQIAFMDERREEDRKTINASMESILSEMRGIKLSLEHIGEVQQAQAKEISDLRMELILHQERSKYIHKENCIQVTAMDDVNDKLEDITRWRSKLADDLMELYFFKKYPKLIYILIFVCVVLALVAIYKVTKL